MSIIIDDAQVHEVSICRKGANRGAKIMLFKQENEEENMATIEELQKTIEELQSAHESLEKSISEKDEKIADLTKSLEEKEVPEEPVEESIEKKLSGEELAKFEEIKKTAEENARIVSEMKEQMLTKELEGRLKEISEVVQDDERADILKMLKGMDEAGRDQWFGVMAKAHNVLNTDETHPLTKELGEGGDNDSPDSFEEIEKKIDEYAKELMAKDEDLSIFIAKTQAWDENPELKTQYYELKGAN